VRALLAHREEIDHQRNEHERREQGPHEWGADGLHDRLLK
jgi:hypothetical protein